MMIRLKSRDQLRFLVCLVMTVFTITTLLSYWFFVELTSRYRRNSASSLTNQPLHSSRKLLSGNSTDIGGEYPNDIFTLEEKQKGAVIFHILGISYMFLALAIVCDEFFVPSLHVISSLLKISDDVAGATFMAAGGSAPELFTSFLGVFVAKSNVGFGTIVGSAVFNILFVIGMCVFFSKGLLHLTWWPLLRDCSFYIVSLALLIQFFNDSTIELWESSLLLLIYIIYVLFMSINVKAEKFVKRIISAVKGIRRIVNKDPTQDKNRNLLEFGGACFRHGAFQLVVHTLDPIAEVPLNTKMTIIREMIGTSREADEGYCSEKHRTLEPSIEMKTMSVKMNTVSDEELTNNCLSNDNPTQSFEQSVDNTSKNQTMSSRSLVSVNSSHGLKYDGEQCSKTRHESMDFGSIDIRRFKKHSLADDVNMETSPESFFDFRARQEHKEKTSQTRVDHILVQGAEKEECFSERFNEYNFYESPRSIRSVSASYGISPTTTPKADAEIPHRPGSKLSCTSHHGMSRVCLREAAAEAQGAVDEEDEEPISLKWPETIGAQLFYIVKFPIILFLFITVPDVRRPGWSRLFPLTFLNSILWIGGFSYFMVWWAALIGETLKIPDEVMGLTFIAAGTSIPDLITSVLVARQGLGDMAVSSSVGSNIFDVTIGLPVPWIVYSVSHSFKAMEVNNKGLFCSTVLLFFMLIGVVVLIALSKWKMSKPLGLSMFFLYVVFLTFTLLIQFNIIECLL